MGKKTLNGGRVFMKKILAITTINNTLSLKEAIDKIKKQYTDLLQIRKIYLEEYEDPAMPLDDIVKSINESDIIIIEIMGDVRLTRELPGLLEGKNKTVVVLAFGPSPLIHLLSMGKLKGLDLLQVFHEKGLNFDQYLQKSKENELREKTEELLDQDVMEDVKHWLQAREYYRQSESENLKNFLLFLLKNYTDIDGLKKIDDPAQNPSNGLYLPYQGIYHDLEDYKEKIDYNSEKPSIGVLFYSGMHFDDTRPLAEAIYEHLRDDANILVVFSNVEDNIKTINKYLQDIDLFINLQYFQINGGPLGGNPKHTIHYFQKENAPYIIGLRGYETNVHEWKKQEYELNPLEIILGVTLPELDGGIEPIFIAGLETVIDPEMGRVKFIKVLPDRMEKLAARIRKWLTLRKKENKYKHLAILTYNYPPGEENLGISGYLDVFSSLGIFLEKLHDKGYQIKLPEGKIKDLFLEEGGVNNPKYHQKSGLRFKTQDYISWFNQLPKIVQKSVISNWGEPPGDIMVEGDEIILPGFSLGNVFLGVQPSRGVHEDLANSYHDKNLPPHHQYLAYYCFLEEIFRADALLHFGMHGTLEFTPGKQVGLSSCCFPDLLIGTMPHIYYYWVGNTSESTIAKRRSYAQCISYASPPMKSSGLYEDYLTLEELLNQYMEEKDEKTKNLIFEIAYELHIPPKIDEISHEIYKMKRKLIPNGFHIMNRQIQGEDLINYLLGVLRMDREYPSILKLQAQHEGLIWENVKNTPMIVKVENRAKKIIEDVINGVATPWLPEGYGDYINEITSNIDNSKEAEGLLNALDGCYITPSRGGDPIRDPDVYPTGKAMYAFDPRQIPTVTAEIRGQRAAELLLDSYHKKYGQYPQRVGIVLWGFETMKTGGDSLATILALMGVRIKHQKGPWFKNLEIIPLDEIGRPRIDVTVTICGIFRDTLATHIEWINRAVRMVAHLEEPSGKNYVRQHYLEDQEELGNLALARVFGPAPTEYATSIRSLVENGNWQKEEELVENYRESMCYVYQEDGAQENVKAFNSAMEGVDLVSQERDNSEYEVTDLDHYYEFLGGLSSTIESQKGEQVEIMVVDSTEEEIHVENLAKTIQRATRTRLLNPNWIEGMLKHEFHGAQKVQNSLEHLLGFAATTHQVESWLFDEAADKLLFDDDMRKKIQENNPYAAVKMGETLLETEKRGYWRTNEEKIKELRNLIINMESNLE